MTTTRNGEPPATGGGGKISDLQVLRGISILMVLVCHLSISSTLLAMLPVKIHAPFFLGVEIFFILSGYVVFNTLVRDGFHAGRFFTRRAFRLYPPIVAFMAVTWGIDAVLRHSSIPVEAIPPGMLMGDGDFARRSLAVLSGTFILNPGPAPHSFGAMWSLSVEFQFYAAAFLLCVALVHLGRVPQRWFLRLLVALCTTVFALTLAMRVGVLQGYQAEAHAPRWLFYCMVWRFDFLALGVMVAGLEMRFGAAFDRGIQSLGNYLSPWLLLLPLAAMSLCETPFTTVANKPLMIGFGFPFAAVCFAGLVLIASRNQAFPATRGRVYRGLEWLGDRSYTIYLLHFPVFILAWMAMYLGRPSLFGSPVGFGVAQVALVTVILAPLCELVYRGMELPCIEYGKRANRALFSPRPATSAPLALPPELRVDIATDKTPDPHTAPAPWPAESRARR